MQHNITEKIRKYMGRADFRESLSAMIPTGSNVDKIANAYINAVATDGKLQRFDLATHLAALTKCVRMGLHPGPLNHVYLIAQRGIIDAMPSYKGMIARMKRHSSVQSVQAHTVHGGDTFKMSAGTTPQIEHEIKLGDRGVFKGVYAIVFYTDGSFQFDYMGASEVEQIKASTHGGRGGTSPWNKWFEQMAKKSIVKRLISFMGFEDSGLGAIVEIEDDQFHEQEKQQTTAASETPLGTFIDHAPSNDKEVAE